MNRKCLNILAVGVFVIGLSQSAFADFQLKDDYNHFYFNIGISANYLEPPAFKVGTLGTDINSKTPLAKLNKSNIVPRADLTFGYRFFNYSNTFLTQLFGHENSVEVNAHYFDFDQSEEKTFSTGTQGTIWYIDGSGAFITQKIFNFKLKAENRIYGTSIYFKGNKYFANPKTSLNPYIGLIYRHQEDKYQYFLRYEIGTSEVTDNENYNVDSSYFGGILGGRFNYNINPRLIIFSDLNGQLLYLNSALKANQTLVMPIGPKAIVKDHYSTTTYRVKLGLGISFKFINNPAAPSLELQVGLDHLGSWPEIISSTAKGQKAHLDSVAVNNYFAGLTLHIPFV